MVLAPFALLHFIRLGVDLGAGYWRDGTLLSTNPDLTSIHLTQTKVFGHLRRHERA
jgi:hypothetical protein